MNIKIMNNCTVSVSLLNILRVRSNIALVRPVITIIHAPLRTLNKRYLRRLGVHLYYALSFIVSDTVGSADAINRAR